MELKNNHFDLLKATLGFSSLCLCYVEILTSLRLPLGAMEATFTKLINFALLEPSHHITMGMYSKCFFMLFA